MATRICGICKLGVRDGQSLTPVRAPEGCNEAKVCKDTLEIHGLYHGCDDCVKALKPHIVAQWNAGIPYEPGMNVPPGYAYAAGKKDKEARLVPAQQFTVETLPGNHLA